MILKNTAIGEGLQSTQLTTFRKAAIRISGLAVVVSIVSPNKRKKGAPA